MSALAAALLVPVPGLAAPRPVPGVGSGSSVPVTAVEPRAPKRTSTDGPGVTSVRDTRLPRPAAGMVPVSGRVARVGDLPVVVGAPSGSSWPEDEMRALRRFERPVASVRVRVWDRRSAGEAGVSGVLLTVARADGVAGSGRVRLGVDYGQFANAFGGDFAGRLRLVALPECALSRPHDHACRARRDLRAVRSGSTLSADVAVAGSGVGTVVAVASTPTSAGGAFDVTTLSQAYSWSAGNQSGSFRYSYPLPVPPAGVGPQPSLALTYDSGVVDGRTSTQNGQASWVGEGWDLQVGYVERSYRPCAQDAPGSQLQGDLCWFSQDNATLVFGGRAAPLVRDSVNGWRSVSDDGLRIEKADPRGWWGCRSGQRL